MKVLVTGANGYLGQGIVSILLDNNVNVVATDLAVDMIDKRAIKYKCNLFSIENPFHFFNEPEVLLHLAWRDGFIHNSRNHINDLPYHFRFIKNMAESGLKKICGMGSMHEVGFFEGSVDENTNCDPISLYGIAKDSLRKIVRLVAHEKKIIYQWLRGFYIVGNIQHGNSIFSKISEAEKKGLKKFPFTKGQNQYDFIDYPDFCFQVAATASQDKINGIINICSGKPEKISDRVERFIFDNAYNIKLDYGAYKEREYDSQAIWGNYSKIQDILSQQMLHPIKKMNMKEKVESK